MRKLLTILAVCMAAWMTDARADCEDGFGECPDGTCAPLGHICCEGGTNCPSGTMCVKDNKCLPLNSNRVCSDGHSYCDAGSMCITGNKCLSLSSSRVCSNGKSFCEEGSMCIEGNKCLQLASVRVCSDGKSFCNPGFMCMSDGKCLSTSSNRYCGGRQYCQPGMVCAGNGQCKPEHASNPVPGGGGNPPPKPAPVADNCLVVGKTHDGGGLGTCAPGKHFQFTLVRSKGGVGCPKEIHFAYREPDTGTSMDFYTPLNVQTCGGGPVGVHTVE